MPQHSPTLREHLELREEVSLLKQNHEHLTASLGVLQDTISDGFQQSITAQGDIKRILTGEDGTDGLVGRVKDLETKEEVAANATAEDNRGKWSVRAAMAAGAFSLLTVVASSIMMWVFAL